MKKKEEELRTSQLEGLETLNSVHAFLSSLPPPLPSESVSSRDGDDGMEDDHDFSNSGDKFKHRDTVRQMMKGTAAAETPEVGVNRVVVTRKLSRRQSIKLEESFGQDNLRSDGQLSAVFLACMYHGNDSEDSDDSDYFGSNDNNETSSRRKRDEKVDDIGEERTQECDVDFGDKENEYGNDNSANPERNILSTADIILRSTVPPWEAKGRNGNTQVTIGPKQFRSGRRLQDRVLEALENAQKTNACVTNNAVRTHFGYYDDSEDDEELRPVIREEEYIANYYEPFGDTFASTAKPPVMLGWCSEDADEGADFFNDFNARERGEVQAIPRAPEPPITSPKKMSAIGSLFSAMSTVDEDDDDWGT